MKILEEEPKETLHIYIVPEEELDKKPDLFSIAMAILALLCILGIIAISIFSAQPLSREVSFTLTISGIKLHPVTKTLNTTAIATGKRHIDATNATGTITFYNGLSYTQIVPIGTTLTGSDGITAVTDKDAVIPPVAKTTPPRDGFANVHAHALVPGTSGNIRPDDINLSCCATSIIARTNTILQEEETSGILRV